MRRLLIALLCLLSCAYATDVGQVADLGLGPVPSSGGGGGSTTLSGDATGPSTATVVVGINGNPLGSTTPTAGHLLIGSGSLWASLGMSGDATINGSGTVTVGSVQGVPFVGGIPGYGAVLMGTGAGAWTYAVLGGDLTQQLYNTYNVTGLLGNVLSGTAATTAFIYGNGGQFVAGALGGDAALSAGKLTLNPTIWHNLSLSSTSAAFAPSVTAQYLTATGGAYVQTLTATGASVLAAVSATSINDTGALVANGITATGASVLAGVTATSLTNSGLTSTQTLNATGASILASATCSSLVDSGALTASGAALFAGGATVEDVTDRTKQLTFAESSQTTGTTVTINTGAQTANRMFSFPAVAGNDTFATLGAGQTFTSSNVFSSTVTVGNTLTANNSLVVAGGSGLKSTGTQTTQQGGSGGCFVYRIGGTLQPIGTLVLQSDIGQATGGIAFYTGTGPTVAGSFFTNNATIGNTSSTYAGCAIAGCESGVSATAGYVGEIQSATSASYTNFTTTATYQQLGTVALTAGAYEVIATITTKGNGATLTAGTNSIFALSTSTASATGAVEGDTLIYRQQDLATQGNDTATLHSVLQISSTTSYYLNGQMTFSAGNPQFVYALRFIRIR